MEHKRKCISCGEVKSRDELIKITKEHISGNAVIQPDSKIFGRSVYLCYNKDCIKNAFKKSKINKMLRTNAQIDEIMLLDLIQNKK